MAKQVSQTDFRASEANFARRRLGFDGRVGSQKRADEPNPPPLVSDIELTEEVTPSGERGNSGANEPKRHRVD
ncbi:MAG: hypothetical protein P4L85_17200 [Paludisphaera borealis]|uniref:hypothetical protein n=1 Tax=Paludisphaera borealis TaxID=1387353 RepID=UPI00284B0416|nr:hypothetical protein [Paludisphaera borealis]MDR3621092.1 hypothetical protein [Paludisphaera borealis]